jgi:hypothetical protein
MGLVEFFQSWKDKVIMFQYILNHLAIFFMFHLGSFAIMFNTARKMSIGITIKIHHVVYFYIYNLSLSMFMGKD